MIKRDKVTKGAPSGFVISLIFHAVAFFVAGLFVVFTILPKEEPEFKAPPPVARPQMKLKKPKVKIKKSAQPKPSSRIVAKVKTAKMPEIQIPDLDGIGDGLIGISQFGGGEGELDLDSITTLFGQSISAGCDFVGTFYDTKRKPNGEDNLWTDLRGDTWRNELNTFFQRGWDFSIFDKYYRSPKKLYASYFVVPVTQSGLAPAAFGDPGACGGLWVVHYKGMLTCPASHTNGITFRFWAVADEFMVVKVDGKTNLAMDWLRGLAGRIVGQLGWRSSSAKSRNFYKLGTACEIGDWITLKPRESVEMEMITGGNGGVDHHALMVEEKGVEYESTARGGPILPAFKTQELTHDQLDLIYKDLPEGDLCLTNGPVFSDFAVHKPSTFGSKSGAQPETDTEAEPVNAVRTWSLADGRTCEAAYEKVLFDAVILRNSEGKEIKVPLDRLSTKDAEYVELLNPPAFNIDIMNGLKSVTFNGGFYDYNFWYVYPELHGHFGVRIEQRSSEDYDHDIQVEMFIVGRQISEAPFLLLDSQKFTYNPGKVKKYEKVEFQSKREVKLQDYPDYYEHTMHGERFVTYAVILTDELGRVIATRSPKQWLIDNVEKLRRLKPGNYFDDTCTRTFPGRPPHIPIERIYIRGL